MRGLLNRVRNRGEAAEKPPEPLPFQHWTEQPGLLGANEAVEAAEAKLAALAGELETAQAAAASLGERAAAGHAVNPDALDAAEARVRQLDRDKRWAEFARARAVKEANDAVEGAKRTMNLAAFQHLGALQLDVLNRAIDLHNANVRLNRAIVAIGRTGVPLFHGWQAWPLIDGAAIDRFERAALWIKFAPNAPAPVPESALDPDVYCQVRVLLPAGIGPTQGVMPGEACWIRRDQVRPLLAQFPPAISFVGRAPEGFLHVPAAPAAPNGLGEVRVKFIAEHAVGGGLAFGSARRHGFGIYREGQVADVPPDIAWGAVVAGAAAYVHDDEDEDRTTEPPDAA